MNEAELFEQEELDDLLAARRAAKTYAAWKKDPSRGRNWEEVKSELIRDGLLGGDNRG